MARRKIGLIHATAIVVASMIGTGIFTTSGYTIAELDHPIWVLAVWAVGGLLALAGADVYAELGAMMPRAGGEYRYLRRAYHPAVGFLSGWVSLVVGFAAPIAASAMAFASYLGAVFEGVPVRASAILLIAAATALHMTSVTWGSRIQTVFTALKVLLLLLFVLGGLAFGRGSFAHLSAPLTSPPPAELAVSLVFVSFAYSGWNAAAYVAGEIERPERNLPRALLGGTASVLVLYLGLNVVFFYAAPPSVLAGELEVGHLAAEALFGTRAATVLSLLISVALISSVSAMTMAGPRVYLAMAEDGLFFEALAREGRGGAPWASVALQGVLACLLAATATFDQLLVFIGFTLSLFSALTVIGAFVLRRREPEAPRPYRARGWPLTPLAFVALSLWMVVHAVASRPRESLAGLATMLLGLVLYVAWRRLGRAKRRDRR